MYDRQHYQEHKEEYAARRRKYRARWVKQFNFEVHNEWYKVLLEYCQEYNDKHGYKKPPRGQEASAPEYLTPKRLAIKAIEEFCKRDDFDGFDEYYKRLYRGDFDDNDDDDEDYY